MTSEGLNISLPPQQTLCLKLLTQGKTIQSIAETMGLSKRTIENYLLIARQKLDCKSLRELISKYYDQIK